MTGRTWWAALVCVLVAGAGVATAAPGPGSRPPAPAGAFTVVTADPAHRVVAPRIGVRTLRGQVVVLAFLDDACPACGPAANLLARVKIRGGVARLGVATGIDATRAAAFAATRAIPMAVDPTGATAAAYGVTALPAIIVIDRSGRLAARFDTPATAAALAKALRPLLAEAIPAGVPPVATRPRLSVFGRPAGAIPPIPPRLRRALAPATTDCPSLPGTLRLAARGPGDRLLYVARAFDGGIVTAVSDPVGRTADVACGVAVAPAARRAQLAAMRARGVVSLQTIRVRGRLPIHAMVVLDGYDQARYGGLIFTIDDNGLLLEGFPGVTTVTLSGPSGTRRVSLR